MIEGSFVYKHLAVSQNQNAVGFFDELFASLRPTKVLEIGTFHGGLSLIIMDLLERNNLQNTILRTYDTEIQKFLIPKAKDIKNLEIMTKNLFGYSYMEWKNEESKEEIKSFIDEGNPTLVLCDGGCKRCEFNLIAPLLKKGDVIMAHDYAPNREYFEEHIKDKVWNWMEIEDCHIQKVSDQCSLQPYNQEKAQQAAWLCRIKS